MNFLEDTPKEYSKIPFEFITSASLKDSPHIIYIIMDLFGLYNNHQKEYLSSDHVLYHEK